MATRSYPDVTLHVSVLKDRLTVCRLERDTEVPDWAVKGGLSSITRTPDELSIVCLEQNVPESLQCERGWRALKLRGPFEFSTVGVLVSVAEPLAEAGVSIFTISTYDTDYILVKEEQLDNAATALQKAGHRLHGEPDTGEAFAVRPVTKEDEPFLWQMLYEAVHWDSQETGPKPLPEELLSRPGLRRYLEGWGRENDFAVVALDNGDGSRVGATWHRTFPASDPGYGFVDDATPEIVLAVVQDRRGAGVGGTLLHSLMDAAYSNGFGAISLGVRKSNPAAVKLYERKGFVRFREDGASWIMKAELSASRTTDGP